MSKGERKLTEQEIERKNKFEILCAEMEQKGYTATSVTVSIVLANIAALFVMLPFIAVMAWAYYLFSHTIKLSVFTGAYSILILVLLIIFIILHELIHGLTWAVFAKSHFKSIDFGVIWSMLTPYCTCSEPMKRWQYLLGCAMPTIVLGFGFGAVTILCHQFFLFLLAEFMIFSGGGDFLIILKMLLYRSNGNDAVYYDHPTECGFVVFEKCV
jgi:hypothetical protein